MNERVTEFGEIRFSSINWLVKNGRVCWLKTSFTINTQARACRRHIVSVELLSIVSLNLKYIQFEMTGSARFYTNICWLYLLKKALVRSISNINLKSKDDSYFVKVKCISIKPRRIF